MTYDIIIIGTAAADTLDDSVLEPGQLALIRGLGGDDVITSSSNLNHISGGNGDDIITASGGLISGGDGFDQITGSNAFEIVNAGSGGCIVDIGANELIRAGNGHGIYLASADPNDHDETISYAQLRDTSLLLTPLGEDGTWQVEWNGEVDHLTGFDHIILGNGNDTIFGHGSDYLDLRTRGGDDYIYFAADIMNIEAGRGNDTVALRGLNYTSAAIDTGTATGYDVVFCGDGVDNIKFVERDENALQRISTFVNDFESGVDKIVLKEGTSVSQVLSRATETEISSVSCVQISLQHGDSLFLGGFTLAQLSAGDFIA